MVYRKINRKLKAITYFLDAFQTSAHCPKMWLSRFDQVTLKSYEYSYPSWKENQKNRCWVYVNFNVIIAKKEHSPYTITGAATKMIQTINLINFLP